eukprot:gene17911-21767_t
MRNAQQLLLTQDIGLNAIRLEGKLQDDDLFEQASAMGLMVLPGICCCDAWQQWDHWTNNTYNLAMNAMSDQLKRLRRHPSVVLFLYSSDQLPTEHVEAGYLNVFKEEKWAVGKVNSAADTYSPLSGHSGVKMAGPYGWVPPNYWYLNTTTRAYGTAYGFATEISPGAAPMTLDSMEKTMPASSLWDPASPDAGPTSDWNYHCGASTGAFGSLKHFTPSINARYGAGESASDYLKKAQLAAYESHRAMFEAYSRNKYNSTGLVQWMLNSAWPSNMWHLFDYYLQTGGAFFGAKKANAQPLHLLYSYDATLPPSPPPPPNGMHDVVQVLHTNTVEDQYSVESVGDADGCGKICLAERKCTHAVYSNGDCFLKSMTHNDDGNTMTMTLESDIEADGTRQLFKLHRNESSVGTTLLRLRFAERDSTDNWYWIPATPDKVNIAGGCFTGCTVDQFANMRDLTTSMSPSPKVHVTMATASATTAAAAGTEGQSMRTQVTVNVSVDKAEASESGLAFFIRLRAFGVDGKDVLPVTWSDNFITLLGGSSASILLEHDAGTVVDRLTAEPFNAVRPGIV